MASWVHRAPPTVFLALAMGFAGCGASERDVVIADIHGMAVDPADPTILYVATHHGLFRAEADANWKAVTQQPFDMMGFTVHPSDSSIMFASGHPSRGGLLGVAKSTDAGVTWAVISLDGQVDFHSFTLSRAAPDRLWGLFRNAIYRSDDGGQTWATLTPSGLGQVASFASSPSSKDVLFAGGQAGIYRSLDGGEEWAKIHPDAGAVTALASTSDPLRLAAYSSSVGFLRSTDGGVTWNQTGYRNGDKNGVAALAFDPSAPDTLYLGSYAGGVHKSTDAGQTWQVVRSAHGS